MDNEKRHYKGNWSLAEVGIGEEDSISPSALIFAATDRKFEVCTLYTIILPGKDMFCQ